MAESTPSHVPEKIYCQRCRQEYLLQACRTRFNTTLTDIQFVCPRCRRRLRNMRLKEWYDRYVHGQQAF